MGNELPSVKIPGLEQIRQSSRDNIYINLENFDNEKTRLLAEMDEYIDSINENTDVDIEKHDELMDSLNADKNNYETNMTAVIDHIRDNVFGEDIWTKYMKGTSDLPYYVPEGLNLKKLKRLKTFAFLRYYLRPIKFFDLGMRLTKFFFDIRLRS